MREPGRRPVRPDRVLGRAPAGLVVPALLGAAFLIFPLLTLVLLTPWNGFLSAATSSDTLSALWLSVLTATLATLVCVLVGLPLVWILTHVRFPGRGALRALVTVPVVLPPVVAGVALLSAFGRTGLAGRPLFDAYGITIPFSLPAVVISHVFVALPFFVLSAEGAVRAVPETLELAASSLGATRWRTFWRVTIPLARPGIIAGAVLAWARSLGEFGATITFAGNYPGVTRTLPLQIYTQISGGDLSSAYPVSVVLLAFCLLVLLSLRERWLGMR